MKKYSSENQISIVLMLIVSAWFSATIIILSSIATESEINNNSYIESVFIPREKKITKEIRGVASFYNYVLKDGWSSIGHFVCATRDFERYVMVKVTNLDNGKWVVCKKTDYGPDASVHPDRVVDLSSTAFAVLAPLSSGLIKNVKIEKYE